MTRSEHMAWCKKRALEYVDSGDCQQAIASMCSDVQKHDETEFKGSMLGMLMMAAMKDVGNPEAVRRWINGFN